MMKFYKEKNYLRATTFTFDAQNQTRGVKIYPLYLCSAKIALFFLACLSKKERNPNFSDVQPVNERSALEVEQFLFLGSMHSGSDYMGSGTKLLQKGTRTQE